jgi:hypothetical protein
MQGAASYQLMHPLYSSVLYLSAAGGPTLVLDQVPRMGQEEQQQQQQRKKEREQQQQPELDSPAQQQQEQGEEQAAGKGCADPAAVVAGPVGQSCLLARRAWLVQPAANRLLMFKGDRLHGVVPGSRRGQQQGAGSSSGDGGSSSGGSDDDTKSSSADCTGSSGSNSESELGLQEHEGQQEGAIAAGAEHQGQAEQRTTIIIAWWGPDRLGQQQQQQADSPWPGMTQPYKARCLAAGQQQQAQGPGQQPVHDQATASEDTEHQHQQEEEVEVKQEAAWPCSLPLVEQLQLDPQQPQLCYTSSPASLAKPQAAGQPNVGCSGTAGQGAAGVAEVSPAWEHVAGQQQCSGKVQRAWQQAGAMLQVAAARRLPLPLPRLQLFLRTASEVQAMYVVPPQGGSSS